jgi:hypothetical protein
MTPEQRLALIQAKIGSPAATPPKPKGLHCAATGDPSAVKPNARLPATGGHWRCRGLRMKDRTTVRATALETTPKEAEWRPEFRKGEHWLTRVAEKWRKVGR